MFEYEVFYDTLEEGFYFLGPGGIMPEEVKPEWLPVGFIVADDLPEALEKFDFSAALSDDTLNTDDRVEVPSGLLLDLVDL